MLATIKNITVSQLNHLSEKLFGHTEMQEMETEMKTEMDALAQ